MANKQRDASIVLTSTAFKYHSFVFHLLSADLNVSEGDQNSVVVIFIQSGILRPCESLNFEMC